VVWKVIEEKEVWLNANGVPAVGEPEGQAMSAIYQRYWVDNENGKKGFGKTMDIYYTRDNIPFHTNWEILYDW
jgi:hypothetical protein